MNEMIILYLLKSSIIRRLKGPYINLVANRKKILQDPTCLQIIYFFICRFEKLCIVLEVQWRPRKIIGGQCEVSVLRCYLRHRRTFHICRDLLPSLHIFHHKNPVSPRKQGTYSDRNSSFGNAI